MTTSKSKIIRRPSKQAEAYLKAGSQGRLLGPLERFLMTEEPEFRSQAVLHPSEMSKLDWCPRKGYLQLALDDAGRTPPAERHPLQRQNIFDEGHYIHDKWQQRFWRQGVLYGKFRCTVCQHEWFATAPLFCANLPCQAGRHLLQYREIPLYSAEHRISGHTDGWIKDGKPDVLIEIKSVGIGTYRFDAKSMIASWGEDMPALWKATRRPFSSHVRQGQLYLALAKRMYGDSAPKDIVFIYENKAIQQFREFVVPFDPTVTDQIFEQAEDIVRRLVDGSGPPPCQAEEGCSMCKPLEGSI